MAKSVAVKNEVRWRVTGTTTWSDVQACSPVGELVIEGLDRNKNYDVEVRAVSACGATSNWVLYAAIVPENNQRVGQGNINLLNTGGIRSAWIGADITYTSTPTSATINVTGGTLQDGADNPTYAAASATVSGTAGATVGYWLYYDDPAGVGGSFALGVTTDYADLTSNQNRIWVGSVSVTFPASGSGGGGGTGGGGGPCVVVDAWVYVRRGGRARWMRAGQVRVGDELRLINPGTRVRRWGIVSYSQARMAPCVRLRTTAGVVLSCSTSAPIGIANGASLTAPALKNVAVPAVVAGRDVDDRVIAIRALGERLVQHITCENDFFLAGDVKGRCLAHHNLKPLPEP